VRETKRYATVPVALLALTATLAGPAHGAAEPVLKPKVPFSGDLIIKRPGKRTVSIRMYYGATHIRMDVTFLKRSLVTIVDRLKREVVLLLPHRREYLKVPSSARARAAIDRLIGTRGNLKPVGPEKVGGIATTKYQVTTKTAAGKRFAGHIWLTSDNIMVQTIGTTPKGAVHIAMRNLRRGKINPALFVIPSGYAERKPSKKAVKPGR